MGYRRVWPHDAHRSVTIRATDGQMIRWADAARFHGKESPAAFLAWAGDFAVRLFRAMEAECEER